MPHTSNYNGNKYHDGPGAKQMKKTANKNEYNSKLGPGSGNDYYEEKYMPSGRYKKDQKTTGSMAYADATYDKMGSYKGKSKGKYSRSPKNSY